MGEERADLVNIWSRSVGVMHIAHHIAASRYGKWHRLLGVTATILAASVGTTIFASFANDMQAVSKVGVDILGVVSILSAGLTTVVTFLNLDERSKRHLSAAADFQRLRREMDEEIVKLSEGKTQDNYDAFKNRWHEVLREATPLPQHIHDIFERAGLLEERAEEESSSRTTNVQTQRGERT